MMMARAPVRTQEGPQMSNTNETKPNSKSNSTAKWLAVMVVLQVLTLIGQWVGVPGSATPAQAQVPDAGAQRLEMIDHLKGVNETLRPLTTILSTATLH